MAEVHIIIPARLNSTRLQNKVLINIAGKPMIQRVFEQASRSKFNNITIATDAYEIKNIAQNFGANVILTKPHHQTGTDRLAEAVVKLDLEDQDIVINVQGDEPLIPIENIEQVAQLLINKSDAVVSTLCEEISLVKDAHSPNNVKVVFDINNYALYFSRAAIPFERGFAENNKKQKAQYFRHIGIYAYKVDFLKKYTNLTKSPIESYESLEQLRVLYHGYKIAVACATKSTLAGVDTLEDLERVRKYF